MFFDICFSVISRCYFENVTYDKGLVADGADDDGDVVDLAGQHRGVRSIGQLSGASHGSPGEENLEHRATRGLEINLCKE